MDEVMTLIERLRNPQYVTNPSGGDALLDVPRTVADMREAADLIEDAMEELRCPDDMPMCFRILADRVVETLRGARVTLPDQPERSAARDKVPM